MGAEAMGTNTYAGKERRRWPRNLPENLGYWASALAVTGAWTGMIGLAGNYPAGVHLTLSALPLMGAAWGHAMGFGRATVEVEQDSNLNTIPAATMVVRAKVPPRQGPPPSGLPRWRLENQGFARPIRAA